MEKFRIYYIFEISSFYLKNKKFNEFVLVYVYQLFIYLFIFIFSKLIY